MFINEHKGPITNREEFDRYPWPDPSKFTTRALEWYEKNLPDDMVVIGGLTGSFFENISWLMGYETMCFALLEQPDLVEDIAVRLREIYSANVAALLKFDRMKIIWGSDDMGFKGGLMISPDHMRQYVLESHKLLASMAHKAGRQYILHSCGKLDDIYNELPDTVGIDGKHSYEDTIESIGDVKKRFTGRMAVLGGIDVDFLCRASHEAIRARVRDTINSCQQGGGFCLGTGNTVANYIPLDNYLVMLDEGRLWGM
jgi:uroporphyrinogen decarboxylase